MALKEPEFGWLARRNLIKAGLDNTRVPLIHTGDMVLGELMARFLEFKRNKASAGELSLTTLNDYLREIREFVAFMKPGTQAAGLRPEHFSGYMAHIQNGCKLGRHSRKRVRAYVTAFLRFGVKNGWCSMPNTGTDWIAPAVDPDSIRQANARAGKIDHSNRILAGEELNKLLSRAKALSPQQRIDQRHGRPRNGSKKSGAREHRTSFVRALRQNIFAFRGEDMRDWIFGRLPHPHPAIHELTLSQVLQTNSLELANLITMIGDYPMPTTWLISCFGHSGSRSDSRVFAIARANSWPKRCV